MDMLCSGSGSGSGSFSVLCAIVADVNAVAIRILPEFHLPGFHSIKLNGIQEGITSLSLHWSPLCHPSRSHTHTYARPANVCAVHGSVQKSMAADCWWSTMVKQLTINERVTSGTYTIHAKSILLTNWILCSLPFSIYTIHILLCKRTAKTISGCWKIQKKVPTFTEKKKWTLIEIFRKGKENERGKERSVHAVRCTVYLHKKYQNKNGEKREMYVYKIHCNNSCYILFVIKHLCVRIRIQSSLCITCERDESKKKTINRK